jgi:hypothetical protein
MNPGSEGPFGDVSVFGDLPQAHPLRANPFFVLPHIDIPQLNSGTIDFEARYDDIFWLGIRGTESTTPLRLFQLH